MGVPASRVSGIPDVPGVPAHAAAFLIETHASLTPRQQAERLKKGESTVQKYRKRLYEAGLIHPEARASRKLWSAERVARARSLMREGMTPHEVAAAMGSSYWALQRALLKHCGETIGDVKSGLTIEEAADALGICTTTVRLLITAGLIVARKYGRTKRRRGRWHIERAALVDFVRDHRAWMVYEARFVRDDALRTVALAARQARPGRWISFVDVSRMLGFVAHTAGRWYARGAWPGPGWEVATWGNVRYLWLPPHTALPEAPAKRNPWLKRKAA